MIMVIFGAGASYDSVPSRPPSGHIRSSVPSRPPLANELFLPLGLFADSLRYFPQCKPIVPYLQAHDPNVTIERKLEILQSEGDNDPERKRQIAAVRWYLQFVISQCDIEWGGVAQGVTNYVTLLDQLRRCRGTAPVLLVTFNYDRLIEEALSSLAISVTDLTHYTQHEAFKLFKLHGSTNWGREVETPITAMKSGHVWTVINELIGQVSLILRIATALLLLPIAQSE
jgi:hypothetical protein